MLNGLRKLWFGDVMLWKSFWIYGFCAVVLLPSILAFIFVMIGIKFSLNVPSFFGLLGMSIFLIYGLFVMVSIWRSANKYRGPKVWVLLAKLVLIGFAALLLYNILTIQQQLEIIREYNH
jgi:hypothetical protein